MTYTILPLTDDPRQVFSISVSPDGVPLQARVEVRYLPAPDFWTISIWDESSGDLLINQIPLICSYDQINDLLYPFRHKREGRGLGSLFCLKAEDSPTTPDPSKDNLLQFQILWGDTYTD